MLLVSAWALAGAAPAPEVSEHGLVQSDHVLGTAVGNTILRSGGNAVDAAIATALAVGVVQPAGSGLGGGGFAVVVTPSGEATVVDFRETAPAAAHRDMYVDAEDEGASRIGGLAVGVPGEGVGLAELHARWGKTALSDLVAPAASLAEDGFEVHAHLAKSLHRVGDDAVQLSQGLFGSQEVPVRGDWVRRERLAKTLRFFGKHGAETFREGVIAEDLADAVGISGGILTSQDLKDYAVKVRSPVEAKYRGWRVISMPPPSSGGVVLGQVLGVLEKDDVRALGHNSAAMIHRVAEAMKHGFADRARFMGDPDRVDVPVERLLSSERIQAIYDDFRPDETRPQAHYGTAIDVGTDGGTQHISVLDKDGLAVSLTTTINTSFASRVIAPKSGVLLNNEMDDFVARPGVPNHYGLVGSEANAVSPGARPLSSMSPTVMISPDGKERIVVGASGGPFIISSTIAVILNIIDFGMDPSEAVSVPRIHHQWAPDILFVDTHTSPDTIQALEALGHEVKLMDFFSSVQVVHGKDSVVHGAADPRKR